MKWLEFPKTVAIAASFAFAASAMAAEMRLAITGGYRGLAIEGVIEKGDYERFLRIVKENQGKLSSVFLYSPGGDFLEAMKIGRALRALELHSQVPSRSRSGRPECDDILGNKPRNPDNCTAASAAFFIHIGAASKGGTYLAVHRPYFDPKQYGSLTEQQAQAAFEELQETARQYMQEMGVPAHIQDDVMGTPSDTALVLDEKTIRTYFWGEPAYRQEWKKAKCARMSAAQQQQRERYQARLLARQKLTDEELTDLVAIGKKADEESKCSIELTQQARLAAYEKFFGTRADELAGHNFGKWTEAPKYIGMTFEAVSSEERFEPDAPMGSISYLRRSPTATTPLTLVSDLPSKKRYVNGVTVIQEPAEESFLARVRKELESKWGKPTSTTGTSSSWTLKQVEATLSMGHAGGGPFVALTIEARANRGAAP